MDGDSRLRMFSLDDRLSAIAALIDPCQCVGDIGTDHGLLGAYLLLNDRCKCVQFTDISAPSLKKAKSLIEIYGLQNRAQFSVGDGAQALTQAPDYTVIAGMGGQTIAHIVKTGRASLGQSTLILQPNVGQYELRCALQDTGYEIIDETIAKSGRRFYVIIKAVTGQAQYEPMQLHIGPILMKTKPEHFSGYAAFRIRVLEKAITGAKSAENACDESNFSMLNDELTCWKEAVKCL